MKSLKITQAIPYCLLAVGGAQSSSATQPSDILPNGQDALQMVDPLTGETVSVRKGTVAAMMLNVKELNHLFSQETAAPSIQNQIEELRETTQALLTSLRLTGIFDLFTPQEWLQNDQQPGRAFVAALLMHQHPSLMTLEIEERLTYLRHNGPVLLQEELKKLIPNPKNKSQIVTPQVRVILGLETLGFRRKS